MKQETIRGASLTKLVPALMMQNRSAIPRQIAQCFMIGVVQETLLSCARLEKKSKRPHQALVSTLKSTQASV